MDDLNNLFGIALIIAIILTVAKVIREEFRK